MSTAPRVDWRAEYDKRLAAFNRAQLWETVRRRAEDHHRRGLVARRDTCAARAAAFQRDALRRVRRAVTVRTVERYKMWYQVPVRERVKVRYKMWYQTWERQRYKVRVRMLGRTFSVWRTHTVRVWRWTWAYKYVWQTSMQWRWTWANRYVYRTEYRWVTVGSLWATVQAAANRRCAADLSSEIAGHDRAVNQRRADERQRIGALYRAVHEAWLPWNTVCDTERTSATAGIRRCRWTRWGLFAPGTSERTVTLTPPEPAETIIRQARDRAVPPPPEIGINPDADFTQVVHLPTWLWVEGDTWQARTARAEAGFAWAEATLTPTRVVWNMGNGDRVVCDGPGRRYDKRRPDASQSTDCSYTYRRSSSSEPDETFTVTATVVYDVDWEGSGGAGGDLGTIATEASVDVEVSEIQALNV